MCFLIPELVSTPDFHVTLRLEMSESFLNSRICVLYSCIYLIYRGFIESYRNSEEDCISMGGQEAPPCL